LAATLQKFLEIYSVYSFKIFTSPRSKFRKNSLKADFVIQGYLKIMRILTGKKLKSGFSFAKS